MRVEALLAARWGRALLQAASGATVDITWKGGFTIALLVIGLVVMAFDWVGPDFIFAGLAALLMAARIITTAEGGAGFANTGVLTVVALYVVAEGIAQTGGLERLMSGVLGKRGGQFWAIVRMFLPTFLCAAFLNNTPIVAMLIPILVSWGNRRGVPPKKLLIPLSYATILGGTCTLIGTSTNLVVAGLQQERYDKLGRPEDASFFFFDITPYGISYAAFGFIYILIASRFLLPGDTISMPTGVLMAMRVKPGSKLHQKTVREAGLKGLSNLFLVSVGRGGHIIHAVGPEHIVEAGDCLYFSGTLFAAEALAERLDLQLLTADSHGDDDGQSGSPPNDPGLTPVDAIDPEAGDDGPPALPVQTKLVQATVCKGSDIVGVMVKDTQITSRFGVRVLAIRRGSMPMQQGAPLGDVVLQVEDVLVLTADNSLDIKSRAFRSVFKGARVVDAQQEKEYITGMRVQPRARMVGKTLGEAGLAGVVGLSVVSIDRENGESVRNVADDTTVQAGDILWFSGSLDGVAFLMRLPGLAHMHDTQVDKLGISILERRLVQASIATDSPLAGHTVRESQFRARFDAVVISISRHGATLTQDVRDVRLQAGDLLLLDTGSRFMHRYKSDRAFNLMSEVPNTSPLKTSRMWWALFLAAVMIGTQVVSGAANVDTIDLFPAAVLTGGIMVLTRCMTGEQARKSIMWDVYVCVAFAFAVSIALEKTDVAAAIADVFKSISESIGGQTAPLVAMYIVTGFLSEMITNNAAAALMYPIAAELGDMLGIKPKLISISIMLGASAAFVMPIGYQCNLMVFAAGGYRTWEFVRFGLPMQLVQVCAAIVIFLLPDQPWLVAAISAAVALGFVAVCAVWSFILPEATKAKFIPAYIKKRKDRAVHQRVL